MFLIYDLTLLCEGFDLHIKQVINSFFHTTLIYISSDKLVNEKIHVLS